MCTASEICTCVCVCVHACLFGGEKTLSDYRLRVCYSEAMPAGETKCSQPSASTHEKNLLNGFICREKINAKTLEQSSNDRLSPDVLPNLATTRTS